MEQNPQMKIIAHIESPYQEKFGIPRQSGLVEEVSARIVFTPEYRVAEAVRGLEDFTHLWLIWQFSRAVREEWSPTVRPPRLGGNTRMGVFATRSPFRPNPIGLSCVRILSVEPETPEGPIITVAGADLLSGTPIYDIKPYIPYADSRPEAGGGFTDTASDFLLQVVFAEGVTEGLSESLQTALAAVLSHDPRPSYQRKPDRVYGMEFSGCNVRFQVEGEVLTVLAVRPADKRSEEVPN